MVDREKVVSVLHKRFPGASAQDVAAAANAIVGLPPEYDLVGSIDLETFDCVADAAHYTIEDVVDGSLRVYRRRQISS